MEAFVVSVEMCRTDKEGGLSLAFYMSTIIHMQRLSHSNLLSVVPSQCHRTKIRWRHDYIARASRSRVAFLRQSCIFLFPSYCLLEAKNARWHRWSHEVKTKTTRFDKMASRRPYEEQNWHKNSIRKWTFLMSSGNVLACQTFCDHSRSCCRSMKNLVIFV